METTEKTKLKFANSKENVESVDQSLSVDLDPLLGLWGNTDSKSANLVKVNFKMENGKVIMQAWGDNHEESIDWGTTSCAVYTNAVDATTIEGLDAHYEFEFKTTKICGNVKLGILVLQVYNTFKDNSNRLNYFSREFYHKISN
ncbi:MAG: hypothetical protein JKY48_03115 [Flavobacteriales bacterium]|nr:hypothetical protein [Flavobacteriales bacterium]